MKLYNEINSKSKLDISKVREYLKEYTMEEQLNFISTKSFFNRYEDCCLEISKIDINLDSYKFIDKKHKVEDYTSENEVDGNFLMSAAIGVATDSALLGGLIGGSFTGAIVGDMLDGVLFD